MFWDSVGTLTIEDLINNIASGISKNIVIMELINVALADNNYQESERAGVMSIARLMNVTEEKVEEIENWIQEGKTWANQGLNIISC